MRNGHYWGGFSRFICLYIIIFMYIFICIYIYVYIHMCIHIYIYPLNVIKG